MECGEKISELFVDISQSHLSKLSIYNVHCKQKLHNYINHHKHTASWFQAQNFIGYVFLLMKFKYAKLKSIYICLPPQAMG